MKSKRRYEYRITAQHIDFQKKVSLASLFNYIIKTAGKDADNNGFGLLKLQSNEYTWVLSRFILEMQRFPVENETIVIETWIQDVGSLFTTRNFTISIENEVIGYASSSWAVINMETRQSVLLDSIEGLQQFIVLETTPIGVPARLPNLKGELKNEFEVKYSHIDVNGHASSIYYIQWLADCFSLDFYQEHNVKRFEINFLKEITYGDKGEVYAEEKSENDYYFQLITKENGISCRARIRFETVD